MAAHNAGSLDAAAALYQRILEAKPRHPDALHLLGLVAHQQGQHARADALISRAIARNRRNAVYHSNHGAVLLALGRPREAEAALRRALALEPGRAEALSNLGNVLMRQGRPKEAEGCYRRAIAARPDYALAYNNLGGALRRQGALTEAEAAYRAALERSPRYPGALANLGRVLHEQGQYDAAMAAYDRALALDPGHAEAHANRATLLLLLGRLEDGFAAYEWRWRVAGFTTPPRDFGCPRWDGEPLAGRRILLHAEQGLGSAIQFVRYAARVAELGGTVTLECQPPLAPLFACLTAGADAPVTTLVRKGEALPTVDCHAPLMSLPHLFGTGLATIPAQVPYLAAPSDRQSRWAERLASRPRPWVGLAWAGNPRHDNEANRSMPARHLAPLLAIQPASFFSLQVGGAAGLREGLDESRLDDLAPGLTDFAETAAVIANLDLVISVDTAVAHLAGALARPVWLLLPFVPEWRWMLDRDTSPWYPTMRLFRQDAPGNWDGLMAGIWAAFADRAVADR